MTDFAKLIEEIEAPLQKRFERQVKRLLPQLAAEYHERHPFVTSISIGMGGAGACVTDDGREEEAAVIPYAKAAHPTETDPDELFFLAAGMIEAANDDPFIQFLGDLQYHPLGFCPDDIKF